SSSGARSRAAREPAPDLPSDDPTLTPTRQRLLDAALALFAERGYDGVTTAEIAARAGVAEKTLFANFISKELLYNATVGPAGLKAVLLPEAARTLLPVLESSPPDARVLLRAIIANRVRFVLEHPYELRLLAQHLLLRPDTVDGLIENFSSRLLPVIE